MYYDLHIHSCLSPCANDEMTPNNIVNMAMIKGLDLIAVTDHNSLLQQESISKVARKANLKFYYGVEVQTMEEVHVLGYFKTWEDAMKMQRFIDKTLPSTLNQEDYFGNQLVLNEFDECIKKEERLLLSSLQASIEDCVKMIHECNGKVVLAHVFDRSNSITTQLGFIPRHLSFDGIEIKAYSEMQRLFDEYPWIDEENTFFFINSDAHQLIDIHEPEYQFSSMEEVQFWEDRV